MTEPHRPEQDAEPTPSISPLSPPTPKASENPASFAEQPDEVVSEPEASSSTPEQHAELAQPEPASEPVGQQEEEEALAQDFPSLGLPTALLSAIEKLGWQKPSPVQAKSFSPFFSGRDVLVQSHTGSGKTGAFCLPWIAKQCAESDETKQGTVRFLAVVPTRELAKQVAREFGNLADGQTLKVESFYGGTAIVPQLTALEQGVDVVIGTPGRLLDHLRRKSLDLSKLETVVLDECDEMLSMGFLEDIRAILEHCPKDRQTGLFSATLPPDIVRITRRYLDDPVHVELSGDQIAAREIDHVYYQITNGVKTRDLLDVLMVEDPPTGIIFCNTREETRMVSSVLQREGYAAQAISSDLTQSAREEVLADMRDHKLRFLVATDVAARGIDISHITHVINYSFPNVAESYVHRTGRTGRAGKSGVAVSLISPLEIGDFYLLKKQYADLNITERDLPDKETLANQRRELKIDRISRDLSKPVSPEWVALARDLQKDPRGERIVAYLLSQAKKAAQRPRAQARALQDEASGRERGEGRREARGERRSERGHERARGRDGGRTRSGETRRARGRDEERVTRRGRRGEQDELSQAPADETDTAQAQAPNEEGTGARTPRRERVARARRDGSLRSRRSGGRSRDAERDEQSDPQDETSAENAVGEAGEERGRRRRRGRSRSEARTPTQDSENQDEASIEAREEGRDEDADPGRRRKRRRRRRGRGQDDASSEQLEAQDTQDSEGPDEEDASRSRNQRRRRRSRNRGSGTTSQDQKASHVDQDKIIIDIDEEELEVVRGEFGEINELDDLTVKGRRRGFLDEIESGDDVILEDLSKEDQNRTETDAQDEDVDDDEELAPSNPESESTESTAPESEAEEAQDETGAKKKRRRRRKKKRQPPPMPELTAPPHKDFWEVWSDKYSATDFSQLEQEDQAELEAQAEQKAQARAKRAEERREAAAARKEAQKAKAAARASEATSDQADPSPSEAAQAAEEPSDFVQISLNVGRGQGCKSATIRKLMEDRCGLGRRSVKDLTVRTASTLLAVDKEQASAVKAALDGHHLDDTILEVTLLLQEGQSIDDASASEAPKKALAKEPESSKEERQAKSDPVSEVPDSQEEKQQAAPDQDEEPTPPVKAARAKKKTSKVSKKKRSTKKKTAKKKSTKKKATKKKAAKKKSSKKTSKRAAKKSASKKD